LWHLFRTLQPRVTADASKPVRIEDGRHFNGLELPLPDGSQGRSLAQTTDVKR
jgi:hypothetical protein